MRTSGARIALAGTLAATGLAGGAVVGPALAAAATTQQSAGEAVSERVERLSEALQGLVDDGTLTDEQRDRVAEALDEQLPEPGHGRFGKGAHLALDVAADTLGLTEADLLAQLRAGSSLADVAQEQGVEVQALTDALVAAAQERLDEAVAAGRLTQEEADEKQAEIAERVAAAIEREGLPGPGRGHRGHGWGPGVPDDERAGEQPEPSVEGSVYTS